MEDSINSSNLILSMLLGDGYAYGKKEKLLEFCHSTKQLGYAEWKMNLLKKNVHPDTKMTNKKHYPPQVRVFTPRHHRVTSAYKKIYVDGRKHMTMDILEKITDIGVAIWYMDDGNAIWRNKTNSGNTPLLIRPQGIQLNTHAYSREDNELISKWFLEKYNVLFRLYTEKRGNTTFLRSTRKEHINRFVDIVYPYVAQVDCMKYKVEYAT